MAKIKAVIQRDLKDCGVSCMKYLIEYYDGYIPLEKLREDTVTDNNGTSAYHIVEAFKKYGFDSYGINVSEIDSDLIILPCICHLVLENGLEHFVVVTEIKENTIYLMDPSVGYKKMEINSFQNLFSGNVIISTPRDKIIKMDKGLTIYDVFINILKKEKFLIIKTIVSSVILTILVILSSYYLKIASNFLNSEKEVIKYFIIVFTVIILLKLFISYVREYYQNHLNNLVDLYIYPEFLRHLFFLPLSVTKTRTTGEIITRVNDLSNIKDMFTNIFIAIILDSMMLLSSIVILIFINKKLFLILFIFMIFYLLFGILTSKTNYKKIRENIKYQTEFNSIVVENVEAFESIKNLNIVSITLKKIENSLAKLFLSNYEFNKIINIINLVKDSFLEISVFVINTYGIISILKGELSFVDLFTFNLIISYFTSPIKNIIDTIPRWNYIKESFNKVSEFINLKEEKLLSKSELINGNISFQNVKFSPNKYNLVLNNFNLDIKSGEHVELSGPSGSGKSTICKIIYKMVDHDDGNILLGGKNIKDLDITTVRENILYVSQNENLFTGTIKENILVGRKVKDEDFDRVCRICHIEEIVKNRKARYESLIESDAKNISGGEKERIIMARGLLKNANILIFDEALSEVDFKLEKDIITNIRECYKDKTIIYISHKKNLNVFNKVIKMEMKNELF